MCGIAGIVSANAATCVRKVALAMAREIAHRGPDDEGVMEAACMDGRFRIGLAHRRLSIIDLASGHQPLGNEDGSVQIVFNGEIYNFEALREELILLGHCMRTRSDTEVIVHAYEHWGVDCAARLRGMFAFAIWDARLQQLFLARDRFGKKPLFLACPGSGELLFASEIKAILAHRGVSPEVDLLAIRDYFAYRYVPAPATLFRGIRKLMPGSAAVWQEGALRGILYFDQTSWLPDNLLERGDRMTMAASLEARMPFMDHELAAFVSGLPDHWRIRGTTRKYILRQAMRGLIPQAILERPKVGFRMPVSDWFRGPMKEYLRDHLCGSDARIRDYVRPQALQRIFAEHADGRQNHEKLLWAMLTLEIWHRQYF